MRVTIKSLKAEVSNLEAEIKQTAYRLRHVERELLASQIDLRPGDDRAGAPEPLADAISQAALDATLQRQGWRAHGGAAELPRDVRRTMALAWHWSRRPSWAARASTLAVCLRK